MATYLILSACVLAIIGVVTWRHVQTIGWKKLAVGLSVLLLLTAVFDNLIIQTGIVAYDTTRISGVYIGVAPIEDFAYSIAAVLLIPFLWEKFKHDEN